MFKQSIKDWKAEREYRLYDKSMWKLENDNMKERCEEYNKWLESTLLEAVEKVDISGP